MIVKLLTDFTVFLVLYYLCHGQKNARCKKKISDHGITFYKDQTNQMPYLVLHYNFQRRFLFFFKVQGIQHSKFHILNLNAKIFLSSRSKLSKIIGPGPTSNLVVSYGLIHVYAVLTLYYYTSLPNLESGKRKYYVFHFYKFKKLTLSKIMEQIRT